VPPVFRDFTAYKNRTDGFWLRSFSQPYVQSFKVADGIMGGYFASLSGVPGYIQDSLIVGETDNKGNTDSWEPKGLDGRELPRPWETIQSSIRGLEYYDGPMAIRRTTFANFNSNSLRKSGALTNLAPNPFWISSLSTVESASFVNANRVWLEPLTANNNGDSFSIFRDIDGSVTGAANRHIVPPNPVLLTSSCTQKATWNAYVCPNDYVNIRINTSPGVTLASTKLVRDDGASRILGTPDQYPTSLHFHLLTNRQHRLDLPRVAPNHMTFVRFEGAGKAARISLAYPTANFRVSLWGAQLTPSSSLADLDFGGTKYFYAAAAKRLHLRLVSDDGSWKEYELNRP
jgi:cell migration-inducing and hyaluronan-binding protein